MGLENDDKSAYSITGTFDTRIYERETANSVGRNSRNEMLRRDTLDLVSSLLLPLPLLLLVQDHVLYFIQCLPVSP